MSTTLGASRWRASLAGVVIAAACGGPAPAGTAASPPESATTPTSVATSETTTAPQCEAAPLEARAATVLITGIGEGTTIDDPLVAEVAGLGLGGVTLRPPNIVDEAQLRSLIDGLRQASPRRLLVGADEEGGRVSRLRPMLGPTDSARVLGQQPPEAITGAGTDRGVAARDLGFDLVFAPVVDADGGPADGVIGDRSFAAEPALAGSLASVFADGLRAAGMVAVAKHFPGQGGLLEDSHAGSVVSEASRAEVEATAAGFQPVIAGGIPSVMMSHATFTALGPLPASVEPGAYALLRSLGFDGVAMTDSLGMGAMVQRWPIPESTVMALAAGADMVLANQGDQATAMRDAVVAAVASGALAEGRLDEAVGRVLRIRGEDPATMLCG